MAIYTVRDNNARVGMVNGRVADRSCAQCCGAACPRLWKALPCHAGEQGTTQCDCPARYPTREIYVCTDATCGSGGVGVGRVFRAEYNEFPGVKFCFHLLNAPSDPTYAIEDVPATATIVQGPLECQAGTFGNGGCDATACIAAGQRALWVRGRSCKAGAFCPWVCAANVNATNDCVVRGLRQDLDGNDITPACCHFVGGAADIGYFDSCPHPNAYWNQEVYADEPRSCCQCQASLADGCGAWTAYQQFSQSAPDCPKVCSNPPYGKALYCCCGTLLGMQFTWFYEERQFGGQVRYSESFSGTCPASGGSITGIVCDSNGNCVSTTRPCYVDPCGIGLPIQSFSLADPSGAGCWGECPPPPNQADSHVVSGSYVINCTGIDADLSQVTHYVWGDTKTVIARMHTKRLRVLDNKCQGGCMEDGDVGDPPGAGLRVPTPRWSRAMNAVRGRKVISVGGGGVGGAGAGAGAFTLGGGCSGCGGARLSTASPAELAAVIKSRTDRRKRGTA